MSKDNTAAKPLVHIRVAQQEVESVEQHLDVDVAGATVDARCLLQRPDHKLVQARARLLLQCHVLNHIAYIYNTSNR